MPESIPLFVLVGFIAQIIDGTLGMAYGVTSTSFVLSLGVPPALASASVHASEIFTSAASGLAHLRFGNVDRNLFRRLVLPGVVGGTLGAYLLTALPGERMRPWVALYLLAMGVVILVRAFRRIRAERARGRIVPLGFIGGFFDALGGGGWGPIVTSTLVARGNAPRFAVGSVNLAEFFVSVAESIVFFTLLGLIHWKIIIGLILGGVLAAPLAAHLCKRIPARALMILVGLLITILSLRTIYRALF